MTERLPVIQHYVPQLLLRRFACDAERKHVLVLDLEAAATPERREIRLVAQEPHFYDHVVDGEPRSLERWLDRTVENAVGEPLKRLLSAERPPAAGHEDRLAIARFVATLAERGIAQ